MLARSVQDPKQTVCKRVLGMEGDEVRIPQSTRLGPGRNVKVRMTSRGHGNTVSSWGYDQAEVRVLCVD